ncbi:uncharacterized protein LOC142322596 [Lycorma delicatula]|uniref:uncharacterized protein LOC142322596 n=1 Tax=Lycorma delicatula TaxID=130591 RepID=UPI003F50F93A
MINNSTKLTNIQKFYYLRSCLTDEALRTIKEIKVSACNYDSAWSSLKQRFDNKRLIIKAHVQGILKIKRLDIPTCSSKNQEVVLATAIVLVADSQGNYYLGRALLDSGSQLNFISQSFAAALGIQQVKTSTSIIGIGNSNTSAKYSVRTTIESRFGNFEEELELLVLKRIAHDLPTSSIHKEFNIPNEVNLADKHFYKSRGIDLLIGASIFFNAIIEGHIKLGSNLPVLQNTEFGWIVSGTMTSGKSREIETTSITTIAHCNIAALNDLENLISSFWGIEELPIEKSKTFEEDACEQHYTNHVKRQSDGRFIVSLPFSTDPTITLGDSKEHAIKRVFGTKI